jgi:hypothetical protein
MNMNAGTLDLPDDRQLAIWKEMTREKKLEVFQAIMRQARQMKRSCLRQQFPDACEEEIDRKLARIFLYART